MENYQQMKWISNPFQEHNMTSGLSIRAKEELIELFEDSVFKMDFNRKKLISFWLSVQENYPTVSNEAVKMLLKFISSYNSTMVRFSSNIDVISIIIVGFTLNYASAGITNPPDGKGNQECGVTGGFVATGPYKTVIPMVVDKQKKSSKNKGLEEGTYFGEPEPEKEVLSRKGNYYYPSIF
ncbi:unnamed protein product [Macrosiphum euphorbiae]|uniref:Uncharacterized protein n=1 Tax=Macrosiphum euphorbiae TaxID=13131 RepID=A0AAV0VNH0_9HEMI|nr:unnamed protein product [Macrosiphum euphorbiae]